MSSTKNSLASLALDLNRVAIGLNRGSKKMAERFFQEALVRKSEVNTEDVPAYIKSVMAKIESNRNLDNQFAEEVLVYSTLIENYVTKNFTP